MAASGIAVEGMVRLGVPQDFGETWLPGVLARFTRVYPSVTIEARVDRTGRLMERIGERGLDLALLWGTPLPNATLVTRVPMAWIGPKGYAAKPGEVLPLALFEPPCVFRQPGIEALEQSRRPWRLAFTSPSLTGLWAAASAGLAITIRTAVGLPPQLVELGRPSDLPKLPEIALSLYTA
jgi:DNA-binding transcriptional LysR family regulator